MIPSVRGHVIVPTFQRTQSEQIRENRCMVVVAAASAMAVVCVYVYVCDTAFQLEMHVHERNTHAQDLNCILLQ